MHRAGFTAIVGTGACCGRKSGGRRDPQRGRNRQKYAGLERQPHAGQSRSVRSYPAHAIRAYHLSPQQGSNSGLVTQCAAVRGAAREHTIMVARHDRPDICSSVGAPPGYPRHFPCRCTRFAQRIHRTSLRAGRHRRRRRAERTAAVGDSCGLPSPRPSPRKSYSSSIVAGIVHLLFFIS